MYPGPATDAGCHSAGGLTAAASMLGAVLIFVGAGRGLLLRHLARGGGLVVIGAVIAALLLARFWPQIIGWFRDRRR